MKRSWATGIVRLTAQLYRFNECMEPFSTSPIHMSVLILQHTPFASCDGVSLRILSVIRLPQLLDTCFKMQVVTLRADLTVERLSMRTEQMVRIWFLTYERRCPTRTEYGMFYQRGIC
jgi:hypothetical protein